MQYLEEFAYGILTGSNLTGLLLYGPPGTGKTMLVKALARESGATMLEISAADVLQQYVGESEKTTRAIFSLARKLHPCIVFIDEVDGLFGKRATADKRHQQTELGQFLREWDGTSSEGGARGAMLVVATNRPYDIDHAILRRLPQRILVNMPEMEDRAEILRIHLKDETLDTDIKIDELARSTPFYTGSDLKNMVVSAAIHCLRERKANMKDNDKSGDRRVIRMAHLRKGKDEIRPTTSKETLTALREFHSKYGNTAKED